LALEREPLNFSFVSGWGIFVFRVGLLDHTWAQEVTPGLYMVYFHEVPHRNDMPERTDTCLEG
jgi:hypothetical protein